MTRAHHSSFAPSLAATVGAKRVPLLHGCATAARTLRPEKR